MSLEATLSNIRIRDNVINQGVTDLGTHTYSSGALIYGSAIISGNSFVGPSDSSDMLKIDNCSCIITDNKFIRGSTSVNSYIRNYGSNDQIIKNNIFDGYTVNGSSDILVSGLSSSSIYSDNKNQTIYVPVTLANKIVDKAPGGNNGTSILTTLDVSEKAFINQASNSYISISFDSGDGGIYLGKAIVNLTSELPSGVTILECKLGFSGTSFAAVLDNTEGAAANQLTMTLSTQETLSVNYSVGTGSILDTTRKNINSSSAVLNYGMYANLATLLAGVTYQAISPSNSLYATNNKSNSILLQVNLTTDLASGSITWNLSPLVVKCRW